MSIAALVNAHNIGSFASGQNQPMSYEVCRLASFKNRPLELNTVPAPRLVASGFYYVGPDENVQCFLCNLKVGDWSSMPQPIDPLAVHLERSPDCPFVVNNDKENLPYVPEMDCPELVELRNNFKRAKTPPKQNRNIETDSAQTMPLENRNQNSTCGGRAGFPRGDSFNRPEAPPQRAVQAPTSTFSGMALHNGPAIADLNLAPLLGGRPGFNDPERFETLNYRNEKARFDSFKFWPNRAAARPIELAKNGFYYLGTEDRVQCAFCKGVLRNWDATDVVFDEHKRHFPMCPFVRDPTNCGNEASSAGVEMNGVHMRRSPIGNEVRVAQRTTTFLLWI